ncbi:hypothetical protein KS4_04880 [Poriferisphaera corsica]|uniref:Phosphate-selective porin O and P n=1 Tax=Poriferisphaera corsica TaxID=2528020 RepID=A0A517YQF8_9BACT|nr:hypothetical protein [Poriferisphaera corsica]QDU32456.1 hypothetical protein KS4_04880 [Poriferisphaera corsica]
MYTQRMMGTVAAATMALTTGTIAQADQASLAAQLQAAEQRVSQLEQAQQGDWLNERRAEEIKGLIRDVIADADSRATLLQDGILAGHDGNFFLRSADDSFRMNLSGYIQFRYATNWQNKRDNETIHGFNNARAKLYITGYAMDDFGYKLCFATNGSTGEVYTEEAVVDMKLDDDVKLYAGVTLLPFLREDLMASSTLLAVERACVTKGFGVGFSAMLGAKIDVSDDLKLNVAISNGTIGDKYGYTNFENNSADIAVTGRADWKLAGDWKQMKDYVAWRDDSDAIFVGAAAHYQRTDRDTTSMAFPMDFLAWTADTLWKVNSWTASLAVNGGHYFTDENTDTNAYGTLLQLAYNMDDKMQPFMRYEWSDTRMGGSSDTNQVVSAGLNYFLNKHNAKFTTDLVWCFEGTAVPGSAMVFTGDSYGTGLALNHTATDIDDNQIIAARAQFQLKF